MADETYSDNEVVLSYHGPLLYEAKVIAVEKGANKPYFVHYKGWNKNWDEWVGTDRLVKLNDEGLKLQQELIAKLQEEKSKAKGSKKKKRDDSEDEDEKAKATKKKKGKKGKIEDDDDPTVEPDSERLERQEIKLTIPGPLKKKLVTDWEMINHKHRLVKLPREHTVHKILTEYSESKKSKKPEQHKVVKEVVDGLRIYFDRALGTTLLYRFEQPQYQELAAEKKESAMSDVYGGEHLLRLMVKLPGLFTQTSMDDTQVSILQKQLSEFIKFLAKNANYFTGDYTDPVGADYQAKVEPPPQSSS